VNGVHTEQGGIDASFLELLEQFRDENPAEVVFADRPSAASATTPTSIGRFPILRQLGQGGYGVVFLAIDPQLKRHVALKVPRPEVLVTSSLRQRFLREAEAAASLNHANVVPVFEAGHVGPLCYIASAYCEGPDLEQWRQRQEEAVPFSLAAGWVQQLAEAVQHAHSRGVWHRDLKPGNVLLAPRQNADASNRPGDDWTPQVADFGLARLADSAVEQTRSGAILGTPAYMAPEQASGRGGGAGPQVDIYGLGAILYFLLTGRPPFEGETPMAILQAVAVKDPPAPSKLREDLPADLEAICLKCLEKDPHRRYANATELTADLQRYLDAEPVRARRPASWERAARWCRRNPALSVLSLLLLLTLAAATVGMAGLWRRAEGERYKADQRAAQLAEKSDQLRVAIDRLFAAVAESDEIRTIAAEPLRRRLLAEVQDYYDQFASQQPDDPELARESAASVFRLAEINALLGDRNAAAELAEQALWQLDQLHDRSPDLLSLLAEYQTFLAHQRFRAGQFRVSRDLYRRALEARKRLPNEVENRRQLACLWSELAASELYAADVERAREAATESLRIWNEDGVRLDPRASLQEVLGYAQCLRTFGALSEMTGQYQESASYFSKAIKLLEPHSQLDSVDALEVREQLHYCQLGSGIALAQQMPTPTFQPRKAASNLYDQALAGFTRLVNERPKVWRYRDGLSDVRYSYAVTLMQREEFNEAEELLRGNVRELKELATEYPDHRTTFLDRCGKDLNLLCVVYRRSQDPQAAQQAINDALVCFDAALTARPEWIESKIAKAEALNNYANVLYDLQQYDDSLQQNLAARQILAPICPEVPNHDRAWRTYWFTYTNPVATYTGLKRYDQALRVLQQYLQKRGDSASVGERLHAVWLLDQLQRYDDALAALNDCVDRYRQSPAIKVVSSKALQLLKRYDEGPVESPPENYLRQLRAVAAAHEQNKE
jgi:hypothetical protein